MRTPFFSKMPRRPVMSVAARLLVATASVVGVAACGSDDSPTPGGPLDLSRVTSVRVGAYDDAGTTASGLYMVSNGGLSGFDPRTGETVWTVRRAGSAPANGGVLPVDDGKVLIVKWQDKPGKVAYAADTGQELWSTPTEDWSETDEHNGRFVRFDPRTGAPLWSVDPASVGCSIPLPDEFLMFSYAGNITFRCPATTDISGEWIGGAMDPATGTVLWQRRVTGKGGFVHGWVDTAVLTVGGNRETVSMKTGELLGVRSTPDKNWRLQLSDGSALTMDSNTIADNRELRLEHPDGSVRWTIALDSNEELLPYLDGGDIAFATLTERQGRKGNWLVALDLRTGTRTVVAGPGPTARGEEPTLRMAIGRPGALLRVETWGAVAPGKDGELAFIPRASG